MRIIKSIGLIPILAMLLSFAGCGGGGDLIGEDLRQAIMASGDDVTSFSLEGTMTMTCEDLAELNMSLDIDGDFDVENMNMYMTMSGTTAGMAMDVETYLITDVPEQGDPSYVMYMNGEFDGQETGWMSMDVPYSEWESQNQLEGQLEAFSFGEVRHAGEENIDGTNCYVFDITLDMDELMDFATQQPGMEDSLEGYTAQQLADMISDLAVKCWVDKETDRPVKQQMQFNMTIEGYSIDYDVTMKMYDYNEPLDIDLPAGINAQPMAF